MAFEAILTQQQKRPKRWQRVTLAVSLGLHLAALAAGVVHSLWQVEEMPLPAVHVTLTTALPPPPPPPPPARKASSSTKPRTKLAEVKPNTLVQPKDPSKDTPKPEEPEAGSDSKEEGEAGGVEGGVQGGVQGGVVGGVVGSPAPPPPPQDDRPKLLTPQIARKQLLINPDVDPYKVRPPPALERQKFSAGLVVCVSAQGNVTGVRIMKPAGPAPIDAQIPVVVRRWRYRPYLVDGRAVPFCYQVRMDIGR